MTIRKYLTPKQKAEVLLRFDGRCAICGEKFEAGSNIQFDHEQALGLDGTNDLSNYRPVHGEQGRCHAQKTKADVKAIAKGKRQRKKFGALRGLDVPPPKFKRKIEGKGFDKTLRRKFDGSVERRTAPAVMR